MGPKLQYLVGFISVYLFKLPSSLCEQAKKIIGKHRMYLKITFTMIILRSYTKNGTSSVNLDSLAWIRMTKVTKPFDNGNNQIVRLYR